MSFPYLVNWRTEIKQLVGSQSEHETEQRKKLEPPNLHTFFGVYIPSLESLGKETPRKSYTLDGSGQSLHAVGSTELLPCK